MNVESGFELADLRGMVQRRGTVAAGTALAVTLASYLIAMALPNEYQSSATILVEPQTVSREIVHAGVGETNLTERLGLMTAQILSRPRLSRIIDELELYAEESKHMLREEVIDLMREAVRVEPVIPELEAKAGMRRRDAEINTFRIYYRNENPKLAAAVAQRLANEFIDEQFKARTEVTQKSLDFMNTELNRLARKIRDVEAQVARVKSENPGRLPEDMHANQTRLERLQSEIAFAQRVLADAISDEAFYRSQEAVGETSSHALDNSNPSRRMRLLELALAEFSAKGFTRKHPDVIKTELELAAIREQLQTKKEQGDEEDGELSIARQSLTAETRRAEQRRISAEREIERLQAAAAKVEALLAETPRVAEKLDALEREYRHLFQSYQDFSNRKLEATTQAQLERRQLGEQFRVIEPAFEAPEPSSPDRWLIVILGAFFGVALGGALAIVLEAADTSVHTPRQLQGAANVPVLGSIPRIWLESDLVARRRRRFRTAFATVALVVLTLASGAGLYEVVNGEAARPAGEEAEGEAEPGALEGVVAPGVGEELIEIPAVELE